jgi:hypothetical protein
MTATTAEGRYGCPVCDDRFDSVGAKKRHIRTKHPKGKS